MRICFVLPAPSMKIAGGYKVVYQYANYFSRKGWNVTIIYDCNGGRNRFKIPGLLFFQMRRLIAYLEPRWFQLNKDIIKSPVLYINNTIPDSEFIVATACGTADKVNKLASSKGRKIYFIQDFENWNRSDQEVTITYTYDMKKIVISKWLREIVDRYSPTSSTYVPNGIDNKVFYVAKEISERRQYSVAMLYHRDKRKRSDEGLKILIRLKEIYPELTVELFGSPKKPKNLPKFIHYTRNANEYELNKIYNNSAIFLVTSSVEGYGLTGLESMVCGCALVSTDCKGVQEYAINNYNALLSPVDDLGQLEENLKALLEDETKRVMLAQNGVKVVELLNLENSYENFYESVLGHTT